MAVWHDPDCGFLPTVKHGPTVKHKATSTSRSTDGSRPGDSTSDSDTVAEPRSLYESLVNEDRRTLNTICFTRLTLDADESKSPVITTSQASASITPLLTYRDRARESGTNPEAGAADDNDIHMGLGSRPDLVVEPRGIEPLTSALQKRRSAN